MRFPTFLHVATEGWILIVVVVAAAGLGWWQSVAPLWIAAAAILTVALLAYFREPDRRIPPVPLGVLAPVDGRVVHRRECHDPFLDREAVRVGIELNRFGSYYLRAPIEGTLLEIRRSVQCPQAGQASWIQTDEKDDVVIFLAEGSMLGERPCLTPFGQRLGQGRRCGRRRLARRIDLYLPSESRVEVQIGDKVTAGSDLIATFVHNSPQA